MTCTDVKSLLEGAPHILIEEAQLPEGEMGRWVPDAATILLAHDLTEVERRCTLVHEMVHYLHGDNPEAPEWFRERQERDCRRRAADILIPLTLLTEALAWCADEHEGEIAAYLNVDVDTLRDRFRFLSHEEKVFLVKAMSSP